jgi:hypothetical protein
LVEGSVIVLEEMLSSSSSLVCPSNGKHPYTSR